MQVSEIKGGGIPARVCAVTFSDGRTMHFIFGKRDGQWLCMAAPTEHHDRELMPAEAFKTWIDEQSASHEWVM